MSLNASKPTFQSTMLWSSTLNHWSPITHKTLKGSDANWMMPFLRLNQISKLKMLILHKVKNIRVSDSGRLIMTKMRMSRMWLTKKRWKFTRKNLYSCLIGLLLCTSERNLLFTLNKDCLISFIRCPREANLIYVSLGISIGLYFQIRSLLITTRQIFKQLLKKLTKFIIKNILRTVHFNSSTVPGTTVARLNQLAQSL